MKRRNFRIPESLFRRISGKPKSKDQQIIEDWKNVSPENRRLVDQLDDNVLLNEDWKRFNEIDIGANWKDLAPRLRAPHKSPKAMTSLVRRYAAIWIPVVLAAAGLILYTLSGRRHAAIVQTPPNLPATVAAEPVSLTLSCDGSVPVAFDETLGDRPVTRENLSFQRRGRQLLVRYLNEGVSNRRPFTVSSPAGSKYEVVLPDNSTVLLNARTELTIDSGYGLQSRSARLKGEAHFDVKTLHFVERESPDLTFIVDVLPPDALKHLFQSLGMGLSRIGLSITVTGTSFDVRANRDDRSIRAMLLRGTIVVRRPNAAPETMEPGHAYILGESGPARIVLLKDLVGQDSWKKDEFYFDNEPVGAIMAELSRWYGVPIVSPANFTDSFVVSGPRSQRINFILDQMKATRHFNYVINHDTIYVSR